MGRKTGYGYFTMKYSTLYNHSKKISSIQEDCAQKVKRQHERTLKDEEKKEKLLKMMGVFIEIFEEKFPEISIEIQSTLFKTWEKQRFNKDLPQANIQLVEKIKNYGNPEASRFWESAYKNFRESIEA